jgi:hypothetical protein
MDIVSGSGQFFVWGWWLPMPNGAGLLMVNSLDRSVVKHSLYLVILVMAALEVGQMQF